MSYDVAGIARERKIIVPTGYRSAICAVLTACLPFAGLAQGFDVTVLGARGEIEDGNLSAFMISPADDPRAVTCDAGALVSGLRAADEGGVFDDLQMPEQTEYSRIGYVLTQQIKGYLISHAHMDHIAGLIAASPDDSAKPIYGLSSVLKRVSDGYFNWSVWPNFATTGTAPTLGKYRLTDLPAAQSRPLDGTGMSVTAFPLAHGGAESTAFLIESGDDALLCFGDTGPDQVEGVTNIADIWTAIGDLVREGKLRAIIAEVSYPNAQPDDRLYGHLTPNWLLRSLAELEAIAGDGSLQDLPVIVSHIKYSLKTGETPQQMIQRELKEGNDLGVSFLIPEQGDFWRFAPE